MHEGAEVLIAASCIHHDVTDLGLIGGCTVEQSQTTVDREFGEDFVGSTELEAEIVLTTFHETVHVVAFHARGWLSKSCGYLIEALQLVGNVTYNAFEGAKTVAKFTFATAARYGEVELHAPVTFIISSLKGGDDRSIGHTLEGLCDVAVVLATKCKYGVGTGDGTRLVGVLPVETDMESLGEESNTCRIGIDTIETDGCITGRIAQEVYTLICVG